jgi:PhnB protein
MLKIEPYLSFNGNTEEAFAFYKSIFGGDFTTVMRFGEMPGADKMPATDKNKIMHIALPIGDNTTLMGSDALDSVNQKLTVGDNFHISISLSNETEAVRIFNSLTELGQVIMPLSKEFWSELFGMCKDKYGIQWMVNYNAAEKELRYEKN